MRIDTPVLDSIRKKARERVAEMNNELRAFHTAWREAMIQKGMTVLYSTIGGVVADSVYKDKVDGEYVLFDDTKNGAALVISVDDKTLTYKAKLTVETKGVLSSTLHVDHASRELDAAIGLARQAYEAHCHLYRHGKQ